MKTLPFVKMHGTGNDFIIINEHDLKVNNISLNTEFISKICNRNFGIGSDGLLIVAKGEKTEFKYIMYNPDGSEAEMCGNGIRCYMKYLLDNNLSSKTSIDVETGVGILHISIENDIITVDMGTPSQIENLTLKSEKLGDIFMIKTVLEEFKFIPVSMGNPHAVIILKDREIKNFKLAEHGPLIERNTEIFPDKTNVEFINIISPSEINMRVWERGAGETLACGTGACASVVAAILGGHLEKNKFIKVNLLGGTLEIKWSGKIQDSVIMKGPAETIFHGEYYI